MDILCPKIVCDLKEELGEIGGKKWEIPGVSNSGITRIPVECKLKRKEKKVTNLDILQRR
jgi:hypothetical protein